MGQPLHVRAARAVEAARALATTCTTWIEMHNALFGLGGVCSQLFVSEADRTGFGRSREFAEIQELIGQARERCGDPSNLASELTSANGRILVRVPRSMHAALLAEATAEGVSLNQLCAVKLSLQLRAITVVMPQPLPQSFPQSLPAPPGVAANSVAS